MKSKIWFDDPRHPMWLLIRQLVVLAPLALLLACGYKNGWSASDWKTLLVPLLSLGLFDVFKVRLANQTDPRPKDEPSHVDPEWPA